MLKPPFVLEVLQSQLKLHGFTSATVLTEIRKKSRRANRMVLRRSR